MTIAKLSWRTNTLSSGMTALCITFFALSASQASTCDGAQNIRQLEPVKISAQQLAEFRAMPPLKVVLVNAPPMTRYDKYRQTYGGIGIDVFCFIADKLGVSYEFLPDQHQTVADKIQAVQTGHADVLIPLSSTPEREKHGLFTTPYYESYYGVIARKGSKTSVRSINDLAKYKVGVVQGVSLEPTAQSVVPATQLLSYDVSSSDALFQALQEGLIDLAVFNQNIFIEKRYREELFDLEIVYTLRDNPRAYRYYFSQSPEHQRIVEAFDRYLAAIDISPSVMIHEDGERQFLERYVTQRSQRLLLQAAIGVAALLALIFSLALLRYRRLTTLLAMRNAHIQQQQQALQEAYDKLETLSQTDVLTGLSNRRHFDEMLAYEYARYQRTGLPLSLLIIDVDYFKSVNDHYGHAIGDEYLCGVARVLKNSVVRATDIVARYGGDEFACLLSGVSPENACKVAEHITQGIAELRLPNVTAPHPQLTLSIGIATVTNGDPGTQGLFAKADAHLYTAKEMGRNRTHSAIVQAG